MSEHFIPVADEAALDDLFAPSARVPVVLFLHDPYCGSSAMAAEELAQLAGPVYLIDVSSQQSLSRRVAKRTGIRHESPQVFVLHAGDVVWSRSHGAITAEAVRQGVRSTGTSAGAATR